MLSPTLKSSWLTLEKEEAQAIREVNDRWGQAANQVEEIAVISI